MIRILIVEDEVMVARRLQRMVGQLLGETPSQMSVAINFSEAREQLKRQPWDLLFLDLNLAGENGFQLLKEVTGQPCETIVVSANTDRALEAFEYGVLDFVPKPISTERLEKALLRFKGDLQRPGGLRFLSIQLPGEWRLVPVADIIAVHGAGNYAELETHDGAHHLLNKSMDQLESMLPDHFYRIHRSHIADIRAIHKLINQPGSRYFAQLKSGQQLPVSRSKIAQLRQLLGHH